MGGSTMTAPEDKDMPSGEDEESVVQGRLVDDFVFMHIKRNKSFLPDYSLTIVAPGRMLRARQPRDPAERAAREWEKQLLGIAALAHPAAEVARYASDPTPCV